MMQSAFVAPPSDSFGARAEKVKWCPKTDSNRRPCPYEGPALPAELLGRKVTSFRTKTPYYNTIKAAAAPQDPVFTSLSYHRAQNYE